MDSAQPTLWKAALKALEVFVWTLVPGFAFALHQIVGWKLSFLRSHPEFSISALTVSQEGVMKLWAVIQGKPGVFVGAFCLVPSLVTLLQHLGVKSLHRCLAMVAVVLPLAYYAHLLLPITAKVFSGR